jgi:hypothetical protein
LNPLEEDLVVMQTPQTALESTNGVEYGIEMIGAPAVWNMGVTGSGIVVANMDTGVQWDHPALKEKYRGWDPVRQTVDHQLSWYDAAYEIEVPYDDKGHGTHTMGTMVGSEGENIIGVAPEAKWIAVQAFKPEGAYDADLIAGAQWLMAPTDKKGVPHPEMAADVVNNSWGGTNSNSPWFTPMIEAWNAGGVFATFSNGNRGPGGGTVGNPADIAGAFAVGAVDADGVVTSFSSRGPSVTGLTKPEVSAPGNYTRSSIPGNNYGEKSGTSMAAPHVAGAAALLLSADYSLTVDELKTTLMATATPRTDGTYSVVPNNGYGNGIINVEAAVTSIVEGIGSVAGTVTTQGEDDVEANFTHALPNYDVYKGYELDIEPATITDNVAVVQVEFAYAAADGSMKTLDVTRVAGTPSAGVYDVPNIPSEDVVVPGVKYTWTVTDYGGNAASYDYTVPVIEDVTAPVLTHYAADKAYDKVPMPLTWTVSDNVGVQTVTLTYLDASGKEVTKTVKRTSGSALMGTYDFLLPGQAVGAVGTSVVYTITVQDAENNVDSVEYNVPVVAPETAGYAENFDAMNMPSGWEHSGSNDTWQWGVPTTGPAGGAYSGDKVYASNLTGEYKKESYMSLRSPYLAIPAEGAAYLQFKQWVETESRGDVFVDYAAVRVIKADGTTDELARYGGGALAEWENVELDLTAYAGQIVRIQFFLWSDSSVNKLGWYLDDVALSATSLRVRGANSLSASGDGQSTVLLGERYDGFAAANEATAVQADRAANEVGVRNLPLGAKVTVAETGRVVATDPYTGAYTLIMPTGSYTLTAEAEGYLPSTQVVQIVNGEQLTLNFVLTKRSEGITITAPEGLSGTSGTIVAEDDTVTIAGYALTTPGVPVVSLTATIYRTRVTLDRAEDGYFTYTFKKADLQGLPLLITLKDANYVNHMFSLYVK